MLAQVGQPGNRSIDKGGKQADERSGRRRREKGGRERGTSEGRKAVWERRELQHCCRLLPFAAVWRRSTSACGTLHSTWTSCGRPLAFVAARALSLPLCVSLFLSSSLARSLVPSVLVCGRASAGGVVAARVHVAVVPAVVMRELHWRRSLDAWLAMRAALAM